MMMTDVSKTRNHVKQALDAVYRASLELHETGEFTDKTLDEAFENLIGSKVKLERWIKENKV
jgi:hypothetical protein